MSRGNRRMALYKDDEDYLMFLEAVSRAKELYPFKLHSLCLMTNHFHMAIETGDRELWRVMQRMLHPYAMNFNRKYKYTGHPGRNSSTRSTVEFAIRYGRSVFS